MSRGKDGSERDANTLAFGIAISLYLSAFLSFRSTQRLAGVGRKRRFISENYLDTICTYAVYMLIQNG
jgi:hypothetical protein